MPEVAASTPASPDEDEVLDELACPLLLLLLLLPPEDADEEAPPLDALLPPLTPLLLPPEDAAPPPRPSVVTAREHAPRRAAPMANSQRTRPS